MQQQPIPVKMAVKKMTIDSSTNESNANNTLLFPVSEIKIEGYLVGLCVGVLIEVYVGVCKGTVDGVTPGCSDCLLDRSVVGGSVIAFVGHFSMHLSHFQYLHQLQITFQQMFYVLDCL